MPTPPQTPASQAPASKTTASKTAASKTATGLQTHQPAASSAGRAAWALFARDVRLAWSQGGSALMVLSFFVVGVTLFPFGVGPEPQILARIAPGVLFVVVLLAAMISLDRIFQADYEDGSLDQLAMSPLPLVGVVTVKMAAHWVSTLLPLALVSPIVGVLLHFPTEGMPTLLAAMLLATPGFSLVGGIGAGLTVAMRRGGVLLSLLVLPLYIPGLIFAVGATDAALQGLNAAPHLALLAATTLISLVVAVPAAVAALVLALE